MAENTDLAELIPDDACVQMDEKTVSLVYSTFAEQFSKNENMVITTRKIDEIKKILKLPLIVGGESFKTMFDNLNLKLGGVLQYDKLIDLIIKLLPENSVGGAGTEVTTYEKPRFLQYDTRFFKYDVYAIGAFILSIIVIYLGYLNLIKTRENFESFNVDFDGAIKDLNPQEIGYFVFFYKAIFLSVDAVTGEIRRQFNQKLSSVILDIASVSAADINALCYTQQPDNGMISTAVKFVESIWNKEQITQCIMNVAKSNFQAKQNLILLEMSNTVNTATNVVYYLKYGLPLFGTCTSWFAIRLGFLRPRPRIQIDNNDSNNSNRISRGVGWEQILEGGGKPKKKLTRKQKSRKNTVKKKKKKKNKKKKK